MATINLDTTQVASTASTDCRLFRLPTEILDIIFNMYFADLPAREDDAIVPHMNQLLWMLTPLPLRRSNDRNAAGRVRPWCYMSWENEFPKKLTVSADWCRFAMRSWLKNRYKLLIGLDHIELQDLSRLKPKTWLLFEDVVLNVSHITHPPQTNINVALQQIFQSFPTLKTLEFSGTDDLLDELEDCVGWFPNEHGRSRETYSREPHPTPEVMFGSIDWVKTLTSHEKLMCVEFPPEELALMDYGQDRDYSCSPEYPSLEMCAALEALEDYVNGCLSRERRER